MNDTGTLAKGNLIEVLNNTLRNALKYLEDKLITYVDIKIALLDHAIEEKLNTLKNHIKLLEEDNVKKNCRKHMD